MNTHMRGFQPYPDTLNLYYALIPKAKHENFPTPFLYESSPEAPVQSYLGDEEPMRKPNILYEDLRSKNRENYEVTLTQKAEAQLKSPAAREPERSAPQRAGEL